MLSKGKERRTGKYVVGYLVKGEYSYIIREEDFESAFVTPDGRFSTISQIVLENTTGRETGIKDCEKVEVFENDVVEYLSTDSEKRERYVVEYVDGAFALVNKELMEALLFPDLMTELREESATIKNLGNRQEHKEFKIKKETI